MYRLNGRKFHQILFLSQDTVGGLVGNLYKKGIYVLKASRKDEEDMKMNRFFFSYKFNIMNFQYAKSLIPLYALYIIFIRFLYNHVQNLKIIDNKPNIMASRTNLLHYGWISLALFCLIWVGQCFNNFGMNKPHYLFHLGDRKPVSLNLGWGYWTNNQTMRMKYVNTNNNLYATMTIHDGQSMFEEVINDTKSKVNTSIRYQLNNNFWQSEIVMENTEDEDVIWFIYTSVENNDYRLVDHEKHTSYTHIVPDYTNEKKKDEVELKCLSLIYPNQTFRVSEKKYQIEDNKQVKNKLKLFGVSANISETYTINHISQTFKHLVRVYKGEQIIQDELAITKKEKKIIDWEKRQIQMLKEDNWTSKSYVVVYTYGTIKKGQKSVIYMTNQTENKVRKFNNELFNEKTNKLREFYKKNVNEQEMVPFVTHVISNLYGGMTFYFGRLYTQNSLTVHKQDYSYSFTPSRLIFPRSFLWDDGFHQSVIVNYKPQIVLDVLTNWMNKIDIFGWIGREQIRGGQISSMMPQIRFVYQDWFEMNPPTLLLSMLSLIQKSGTDVVLKQKLQLFFLNFYRKIEMWYRYFKNTQSHQSLDYEQTLNSTDRFFRWHCKDQCSKGNFMGSGLDDYPRRTQQTQIAKQHVDLLSWLYFFSESLAQIGEYMQKSTQNEMRFKLQLRNISQGQIYSRQRNKYSRRVKFYKRQAQNYMQQLYNSFYDENDHLFKDIVVSNDDLFIEKFVDKIGYINLFPFFTGMLAQERYKNSDKMSKFSTKRARSIKKLIEIMSDEKLLLSQDGLRSLSFSDPLYGTDDNYWRGAVWLPINYMVLRACKLYYWNDSQVSDLIHKFYTELRNRTIGSVYKNYKETGYLYENYYEGEGHRGFPFYGWTATIANIITQQY